MKLRLKYFLSLLLDNIVAEWEVSEAELCFHTGQ